MFKTIDGDCQAEDVIKKSRFIALAHYTVSESDAKLWLESVREKYYDARHIAYAYRIIVDKNVFQKSSDDGEPSGTAGKPILNLIINENLINIVIAVVRYFGGIKLGTGGLARAYGGTANLLSEHFVAFRTEVKLHCDIRYADRLLKYLDVNGYNYTKTFGENLQVKLLTDDVDKLKNDLNYVDFDN